MTDTDKPKELTPVERTVAAGLLELAAETYSNHGCNDYYVPNAPGYRELVFAAEKRAGVEDPETRDHGDTIGTEDALLMVYLAARLKGKC